MSTDRRQRKTRAAIQQALMELTLTKDLSEISVTDLSDRADINRSTFYLHYKDVPDVMNGIQREIVEEIIGLIEQSDFDGLTLNPYPVLKTVSEGLKDMPILEHFLCRTGGKGVYDKVQAALRERLVDLYLQRYPLCEKEAARITVSFVTAGIFGVFERWMSMNPDERPPLEKICDVLSKLITGGVKSAPLQ